MMGSLADEYQGDIGKRREELITPALAAENPKSIIRRIASGTAKVAAAATVTASSAAAMRGL